MVLSIQTEIQYIKGVGPYLGKLYNKLGIFIVKDLLYTFPRSYDDRRNLPKIAHLKLNETQGFFGRIEHTYEEPLKRRNVSIIKCALSDQTGQIVAIWFNQPFLLTSLKPGRILYVKGKVERNTYTGTIQVSVSDYELIKDDSEFQASIGKLVAIYPLVNGLTQYKIRTLIKQCTETLLPNLEDPLPSYIKDYLRFIPLKEALSQLHFPKNKEQYLAARTRIVFDELFYFQLALMKKRYERMDLVKGEILTIQGNLSEAYLKSLPYSLTNAQQKAIEEIKSDVTSSYAMNRLLQGDVGSGKTDVAVMALLFAIQSHKKGAIMAPTEILAQQHYYKFKKHLDPWAIPILLLKGKLKKKAREEILKKLKEDQPLIIIGTHALLEEDILISNLGMVIIDEQHRFGVMQRRILLKKGINPHCLYMTATPIPRSLLLTAYGDLFKTIIDELPPGRTPPKTHHIPEGQIAKVYQFCRQELQKEFQAYIVYPLVEESEKLDLQAAIESAKMLSKTIFPDYKVGLLHGKMPAPDKELVMAKFRSKEIQVLVATTVIEVGIDVPNANIMIIQHAERFGLSQLHQLRGRIGRGKTDSFCFLVAKPKSEDAKKRITAMIKTTDGFKIAEYDLAIRGPGDLLGTRQSGMPEFNLADLIRDEKILILARKIATKIIQKDPKLQAPQNQSLNKSLKEYSFCTEKDPLN